MPASAALADDLVEHRHEHVEPFDREARLAGKRPLQEALERLDLRQPIEQLDRIDRIGGGAEAAALRRLPQPLALLGHEHVRVVVADGRAVDPPQRLDRVERRRHALERSGNQARGQPPQIVVGDAVRGSEERRVAEAGGSPSGSSCAARWP